MNVQKKTSLKKRVMKRGSQKKWSGSGYRGQLNANAWRVLRPQSQREEVATTSGQRGNLGHEDKNQFLIKEEGRLKVHNCIRNFDKVNSGFQRSYSSS